MLNKVILIGNLGRDVQVHTGGTRPCATFPLATEERWKNQNGDPMEKTEWHNIVAWGRLADICAQYLRKGSKVYIEGKIQTRKYVSQQDGVERTTAEIIVSEMKMLDTKGGGNGGGNYQRNDGYAGGQGKGSQHRNGPPPHGDEDLPF